MSYWAGVAGRVLPALIVGVVAGSVFLLVGDLTDALVVGVVAFVAAAAIPAKRSEDQPG